MTGERILVVDDHAANLALARYVLEAANMQVDTASDAAEALSRLAAGQPALILMDIQMPGVDGLQLTRQLKADAATRDIVIVAFTAYVMKGDEARMYAAGCDGYLSKPIDVATFAASVRGFLKPPPAQT